MTSPGVDPVGKIKADLDAASGRFSAAQAAAAAVTKAREVASHSTRQGFHGIGKGVSVAVRRLEQAGQATGGSVSDVKALRQRVDGVPKDSSAEEVVSRLSPVTQQLATVRTKTMGVYTTLTDAETALKGALQGGQPGPLLALVARVRDLLRDGHQLTGGALQGVEAAIKEARRSGN